MKKIAIIMPFFFDYEKIIEKELIQNGYQVYLINDNWHDLSIVNHLYHTYFRDKSIKMKNEYYLGEIEKLPDVLDYILIISGRSLSLEIMNVLRNKYKKTKMIMYQWDCVSQVEQAEFISNYCDDNITFDPIDAGKYGWKYRPLFFDNSKKKDESKIYDLAYVCSLHSERYELYKILKENSEEKGLKLFDYIYCGVGRYLNQRYFQKNPLFDLDSKVLRFNKLSHDDTVDVYNKSKCLVDYKFPAQTGLTMRTIESVGFKTKLITNNKEVLKQDFYNPNNIFVYDLDDFSLPEEFIDKPYEELDSSVYDKYSIKGWLSDVLDEHIK